MNFEINETHFEYLLVQVGSISDLDSSFELWKKAYENYIESLFKSMKPVLPSCAGTHLDIGGGLGGLGVRLVAHYGQGLTSAVLDGKVGDPEVIKHGSPFNNATCTHEFMRVNGVKQRRFYSPDDELDMRFDIITSTQAWCMHIPANVYLDKAYDALAPGGVLIVDVRRHHPEWLEELAGRFGSEPKLLCRKPKWDRVAFVKAAQP